MTPEGRVKNVLKKRLDELGAYHFWPVQMGYGSPTIDCIGCYKGQFFGIEAKAPGKKPTDLQHLTMENMRLAGGRTFVVDSLETARAFTFDPRKQAKQAPAGAAVQRRANPISKRKVPKP